MNAAYLFVTDKLSLFLFDNDDIKLTRLGAADPLRFYSQVISPLHQLEINTAEVCNNKASHTDKRLSDVAPRHIHKHSPSTLLI